MECSDRIYHRNELGCSRRCTCHNAVHLNFGNVSLLLSKTQLDDFAAYIDNAVTTLDLDNGHTNTRDIYIPTRDLCIHFVLSYNELKALLELSEQTLLSLQIEEALRQ